MSQSFYRGAHAVIIVFDMTCDVSFDEAKTIWYKEAKNLCSKETVYMLIGNKDDSKTKIDDNIVNEFCNKNNILYFKTSAKEGTNVQNSFLNLSKKLLKTDFKHDMMKSSIKLDNYENKENDDCNC